ncbi:MAG: hypothetical protein HRU05_05450 [Oceanospirillaceae bacterium]|nr:hypothetical protein [Oceanospirillaceae bacterium]
MFNNNTAKSTLANSIIDTIIGYDETKKNETKQLQSQRILKARRAIEQHHEKRQLCASVEDLWLAE